MSDRLEKEHQECHCGMNGESLHPYYGLAPHDHDLTVTGSFVESTKLRPREEWPKDFEEDPDCPGCGIWHCPKERTE